MLLLLSKLDACKSGPYEGETDVVVMGCVASGSKVPNWKTNVLITLVLWHRNRIYSDVLPSFVDSDKNGFFI